MIENTIKNFRFMRSQGRRGTARAAEGSQRRGLAQRQIAQGSQRALRASEETKEMLTPVYNPGEKIQGWADELDSMREQRRLNREQSTTGALEENPLVRPRPTSRWDGPVGIQSGAGGRAAAEQYLGRNMSDQEWEMLNRTTYAEATDNPEEQAAIMTVILNRVKADNYPDSIVEVVEQPNQFQAVTGTRNNPRPSSRFLAFNDEVMATFESDVTPRLMDYLDKNWLNFTAANPAAYGEGTNPGFMDDVMGSTGSMQIGGTLFGTVGQ